MKDWKIYAALLALMIVLTMTTARVLSIENHLATPTPFIPRVAPTSASATNFTNLNVGGELDTQTLNVGGTTTLGNGANYTRFDADGSPQLYGAATEYDDLRIEAMSATKGPTAPTDEAGFRGDANMYSRNFLNTQADEVQFSVQMPHAWREGSGIDPHVHFSPWISTTNAYTVSFVLNCYWANVSSQFPAATTLYTMTKIFTTNSQWYHLIADHATEQAMPSGLLSEIGKCRLYRDNTVTGNYPYRVAFLYFDIHYEVDSLGSRQEYVK